MKKQSLKIILTVIWLLAAGICYSCSHVPSHSTDSEWKLELSDDPEDTQEETTSDDRTESDPAVLYVYVCGEIQNPGVWELRPGDRIFRAIEMAGGVTEDAAVDSLNLAAEVTDGMKLWVPSREEMKALGEKNGDSAVFPKDGWSGQETAEGISGGKVNLNAATLEQLMTLRGIGEARARDIIAYREKHGDFQRIEDIKKVSGIKDAAFQKIKDDITV